MYLLTEITTRPFSKTYKVSIGGNGNSYISDEFSSDGAVQASINITREYKNEIIKKCENADTVQKIKIVHDYLVDTIDYDADAGSNVYNIYGALVDKKAVCEGYARACKYILDDLGIPCIIACGVAKNSQGNTQSHAWNYVQIDGQWYALDVTWDDPVGTGRITDEIKYAYFLKGGNNFFTDHYEDGNIVGESNFQYPKLSVLDYVY
jgi:transglutaminase/protease-like cytokinesis protein 3